MAKTSIITEQELLLQLKAGDELAYVELYGRYQRLLLLFAYKKLRDKALAQDMVQELFVKLWEKRSHLQEDGNLQAYLYQSLRNRMLDHLAHQQVKEKFAQHLTAYGTKHASGQTDAALLEKELSTYIAKQIAQLPPKMRQVFELSRGAGLSNREVAQQLNTSESNVSHQLAKALKILRRKMGG